MISRGLGSGGWGVSFVPNNPGQSCSTTITATATITTAGGMLPANVAGNPSSITFTANFAPEAFPPNMSWFWSPFCGDPAAGLRITVTAGGQSSSKLANAPSCAGFSGHSQVVTMPGVRSGDYIVGMAPTATGHGYWEASAYGLSAGFGDAPVSLTGQLKSPIVGVAGAPTGVGDWLVASDGGIFTFGSAQFLGSMGGIPLAKPVVGMAATATGHGYWLVASDGGIFSFGDAVFYGSMGGIPLAKPVVGMAATASGHGYWLVASDGGIFSFGDAVFYGSMGGTVLDRPVVGMAATPTRHGYWLVASDGGIFSFGDAVFYGSQPFG